MTGWTTAADIRTRVRRRWDDESMLRALAANRPFPVIDIPLRGPRPAQIGDDLTAVRSWVAALESGRHDDAHYELEYGSIGGRLIGRNEVPVRARVTSYQQAWTLLGVAAQARKYAEILELVASEPTVHAWVAAQPLRALRLGEDWPGVLNAYRWLVEARGSGMYLRQITAPGVDTKFVERHRSVLAQLLGVPSAASGFVSALGLSGKSETVRLRASADLALAAPFSEVAVRLDELAGVEVTVRTAMIVENEITFLSVPVPDSGIVLWGKGFEVNRPGSLPWLRAADVLYWGDLDTHGFAILNQLRAWLPQTRSLLMDRDTLLNHRDRWVRESSPTAADLSRLTTDEAALYADLVSDRFGDHIRLEQERIDWTWVEQHLPYKSE